MTDIEQALAQADSLERLVAMGEYARLDYDENFILLARAYRAEKSRADALAKRLEAALKVVDAARVLVEEFEPDYIESDRVAFELSHSIKSFDAQSSEGK